MYNANKREYAIAIATVLAGLNIFEAVLKKAQDDILSELVANEKLQFPETCSQKQNPPHSDGQRF